MDKETKKCAEIIRLIITKRKECQPLTDVAHRQCVNNGKSLHLRFEQECDLLK